MQPFHRSSTLLPLGAFALCLAASSDAHAGRGLVVVNTGEDVMKIADISDEAAAELDPSQGRPQIGVMYSRFGVFWLDVARWNPQFVLYVDDGLDGFSYQPGTPAELAAIAGVEEDEIRKPIRFFLPPAGVVLGLGVVTVVPLVAVGAAQSRKRRATLMADARYQAAVAQFNADTATPVPQKLEALVATLSSQGIPAQEARENLVFLCDIDEDATEAA